MGLREGGERDRDEERRDQIPQRDLDVIVLCVLMYRPVVLNSRHPTLAEDNVDARWIQSELYTELVLMSISRTVFPSFDIPASVRPLRQRSKSKIMVEKFMQVQTASGNFRGNRLERDGKA